MLAVSDVSRLLVLAAALVAALALPGLVACDEGQSVFVAPRPTLDTSGDGRGVALSPVALPPTDWQRVALADDPFAAAPLRSAGAPAPDPCPAADLQIEVEPEGTWLEVDTTLCAWTTVRQPLPRAVAEGESYAATIRWFALTSQIGPFRLSLAVGAPPTVVWQAEVPSPGPEGVLEASGVIPFGLAAGAPVWWHLENHGDNSWRLMDARVHP